MSDLRNIVILTGAGISAESGLQTLRAADGLWGDGAWRAAIASAAKGQS